MRKTIISAVVIAAMLGTAGAAFADDPLVEEAPVCADSQQKVLWPPNHKFKHVDMPTATDPEGGELTASAPTVMQDEPINGTGDGDTAPDWEVVDAHHVRLRAERSPTSPEGRTYTITVTVTDSAGSSTSSSVTVRVPL